MQHSSQKCQASPPTLCSLASTGLDWSTATGCPSSLFEERLWPGHPTSPTARWPNVAGTPVPSLFRRPALSALGPTHRTPDHVPLARKAARAAVSATSPDDADVSSALMPTSPLPLGLARSAPVLFLVARTATCAATSPIGTSAGVSATTQIADYRAPPASK